MLIGSPVMFTLIGLQCDEAVQRSRESIQRPRPRARQSGPVLSPSRRRDRRVDLPTPAKPRVAGSRCRRRPRAQDPGRVDRTGPAASPGCRRSAAAPAVPRPQRSTPATAVGGAAHRALGAHLAERRAHVDADDQGEDREDRRGDHHLDQREAVPSRPPLHQILPRRCALTREQASCHLVAFGQLPGFLDLLTSAPTPDRPGRCAAGCGVRSGLRRGSTARAARLPAPAARPSADR